MKIKDRISQCPNKIQIGDKPVLSFALPEFLINMAAIISYNTSEICKNDVVNIRLSSQKPFDKTETPTVGDLMRVFNGQDLPRHMLLFSRISDFLNWFVELEDPDDLEESWDSLSFIAKKWNEWGENQKNSRRA